MSPSPEPLTAHTLSPADALAKLDTTNEGLSSEEAARRLEQHGPNALPEAKQKSLFKMILGQFTDFLVVLLLGAAVVSGLLGDVVDTIAIGVILVLNATIGVVEEVRAQKAMDALRKLASVQAAVLRDGDTREVDASQLTLGDVVLLDAGRVVPADLRLLESARLRLAEAALTGESVPVDKQVDALEPGERSVGDKTNMAFRGTQVVHGRGVGVVTAIGSQTELGRIAGLLEHSGDARTPLQKRLARFGRSLGLGALALCAVVFGYGLLRGEDPLVMFLTAVSLAVAAVPEALPAVATVTLALGASRLVRTQVLVRKLPSVETLGSVTYICSDKTGTLTQNRMSAEKLWLASGEDALPEFDAQAPRWLGVAMAISNDVGDGPEAVGDPTELAIVEAAKARGYQPAALRERYERVAELPFDADRKLMTTVHRLPDGGFQVLCKGAAEALLPRVAGLRDEQARHAQVEAWAADGLRVLAFGSRRLEQLPEGATPDSLEQELELLGFVGLMDPPREEARAAVQTCLAAGIRPVMVTGDHPATALAIARRLGIAKDDSQLLTGTELSKLSKEELRRRVKDVRVYARVAPAQKLDIVEALQANGEFVGMTGDGVNDAPALNRADIGIAMGITGTDVAKEAADMVLLDDNFASIVESVREGRRIFDNIRKFIKYTMTSNAGEIWPVLLAPAFGMPVPLLPIHILWVNLVTDGLPGLALSAEPTEQGVMERPPRPPAQSIFADGLLVHLVWVGALMGAATLVMQWYAIAHGMHWRSMVFTVLCFSQMGHAMAVRSDRQSIFAQGPFSNLPMLGAVLSTVVLQLAVLYVPFLNTVFKTTPLSPLELGIALGVSSVVFWAVEAEKLVKRALDRRARNGQAAPEALPAQQAEQR